MVLAIRFTSLCALVSESAGHHHAIPFLLILLLSSNCESFIVSNRGGAQ